MGLISTGSREEYFAGTFVDYQLAATTASTPKPVVFVIDPDSAERNSLERLIRAQNWHSKVFASAEEFLVDKPLDVPSCLLV